MTELNKKNMGFADKALFILGLTLCGVVAFVLVAGVVVALLKWFMDGNPDALDIRAVPELEASDEEDGPFIEGGDPHD